MGYTHYWTTKSLLRPLSDSVLIDVRHVLGLWKAHLCSHRDRPNEPPVVSKELILFNGKGSQGHDAFRFDLTKGFHYCKTDNKPYNTPVTAVLILLKDFYRSALELDSDETVDQWKNGIRIAERLGIHFSGFDGRSQRDTVVKSEKEVVEENDELEEPCDEDHHVVFIRGKRHLIRRMPWHPSTHTNK